MTRYTVRHNNEYQYSTDSAGDAFGYVLRNQGQSVDFATQENGWAIDVHHRAFIGRTAEGDRVWVEIQLATDWRDQDSPGVQTVEHGTTHRILRVSITGSGVYKGGRSISFCGQIIDTVAKVRDFRDSGWRSGDVRSLVAIWERWHLNDMRPECAHMDLPEDRSYDARRHITCPITGYKYGSAWLYEDVPGGVIAELERLIELPSGSVPEYV